MRMHPHGSDRVRAVAGGQLELTNRSGQEVLVRGYRLEPYLRVGPDGVFENQRAPSAYTNRFSTAPASIPARLSASVATRPPSSAGRKPLSEPPKSPTAVRTPLTM